MAHVINVTPAPITLGVGISIQPGELFACTISEAVQFSGVRGPWRIMVVDRLHRMAACNALPQHKAKPIAANLGLTPKPGQSVCEAIAAYLEEKLPGAPDWRAAEDAKAATETAEEVPPEPEAVEVEETPQKSARAALVAEAAELRALGKTYPEIGELLGVSTSTARKYVIEHESAE